MIFRSLDLVREYLTQILHRVKFYYIQNDIYELIFVL